VSGAVGGAVGPSAPTWDDVDGWRRPFGEAATVAAKRAVVARRAEAADGRIEGGMVHLPPGLRACLGLAELRTMADVAGLEVRS
jgi:hypothetical protein